MYYNQEVVRQLPLVSIKYLLFDTTSLFRVTAFAGVVSLYYLCVCMAEVSKIYRTNI